MASTKDASKAELKDNKSKKLDSKKSKKTSSKSTEDKKSKKRKVLDAPVSTPEASEDFKKQKKADSSDESHAATPTSSEDTVAAPSPNALDNFPLSDALKAALRSKGIDTLFDIQAACLSKLLEGKDLVGRARTGCGKTLAFVLPIVERVSKMPRGGRGRAPSVIVLAPTRELAKQVGADFETYGRAMGLDCLCVYGGAAMAPQEGALRRGVDVVVGTPGRVKDHLERGTLSVSSLKFRVLDECDEMLNMGFVDDVETILNGTAVDTAHVQTLLFSATLPSWVRQITKRFLKADYATVDLVGDDRMKASTSVRHLLLPCHWSQRAAIVQDLVRCYGALGRTIVFTDTKVDADSLAAALSEAAGARALHGDVPQGQREQTLAGFRSGKFSVLVATDVAARGLDIKNVELVVQSEPPKEAETYIHRSGRTGRAHARGTCITLVSRSKEYLAPMIEKKAGMKFTRIGAPQPADMARVAGERAAEALGEVDPLVVDAFRPAAKALLTGGAADVEELLAGALAKMTGIASLKSRSLITAQEDYATLRVRASFKVERGGQIYGVLRKAGIDEASTNEIKSISMLADGTGAVFDVPVGLVSDFLQAFGGACDDPEEGGKFGVALSQPTELPEIVQRHQPTPPPSRGGFGGRGGSRGGGMFRRSSSTGSFNGSPGGRGRGRGGGGGGYRGGRFANRR